jgi:hypothetical protein
MTVRLYKNQKRGRMTLVLCICARNLRRYSHKYCHNLNIINDSNTDLYHLLRSRSSYVSRIKQGHLTRDKHEIFGTVKMRSKAYEK